MTDLYKRSALKLVALTAVAAAALLGCGKKEEAKPAAAAPAAAASAPAKVEPLKIAFAISIPLTGFNLSIQYGIPEFPCLKGSPCLALTNVTFVQCFKLFTPTIVQTYTRKD